MLNTCTEVWRADRQTDRREDTQTELLYHW